MRLVKASPSLSRFVMRAGRLFSICQWLPLYERSWLRLEVVAGFTTAAYAVPVSLAYASLADLAEQSIAASGSAVRSKLEFETDCN